MRNCRPKVYYRDGQWHQECTLTGRATSYDTLSRAHRAARIHAFAAVTIGICCRHGDKRCTREECCWPWSITPGSSRRS